MHWLTFVVGIFIGMQYIPYQLKKKNPKVVKQVEELLRKAESE